MWRFDVIIQRNLWESIVVYRWTLIVISLIRVLVVANNYKFDKIKRIVFAKLLGNESKIETESFINLISNRELLVYLIRSLRKIVLY